LAFTIGALVCCYIIGLCVRLGLPQCHGARSITIDRRTETVQQFVAYSERVNSVICVGCRTEFLISSDLFSVLTTSHAAELLNGDQ